MRSTSFNLLGDNSDENGAAKELKFFYPITPTIAITIHHRHEERLEQCIYVKADEIMTEHYNTLIGANADRWIFAQTAEEIQNIALALNP